MIKSNLVAGILALSFFSYAQYAGWNLFDREAGSQTSRINSGRTFHK
ncbi:MAG: hypothetical protein QG572_89 [Pseudomonadota bacterium]|nr:hypothetical protein [Pseudomonadota bacterium]MDQ5941276.1 hypothetical protein [Pseudomonadota bacterium]